MTRKKAKWVLTAAAGIIAGLAYLYQEYLPKIVQKPASVKTETIDSVVDEQIKIMSWNIENLGESKSTNPEKMKIIAPTLRMADLVAIQEVSDIKRKTMPRVIDAVNEIEGAKYDFIESPRSGDESYAFVYNSERITPKGKVALYRDNRFSRPPAYMQFSSGNFDFIIASIHTKPENAVKEIEALEEVMIELAKKYQDDNDVIILGDYNSDGSYFSETISTGLRSQDYIWAIGDDLDTTVAKSANTYDRIVFKKMYTAQDFTGQAGVLLLEPLFNIPTHTKQKNDIDMDSISDHYPVWAIFYTSKDND